MMRQLFKEGWIPHVARQAVGCFLTRGALWICWEEGFKVSVIIILLSYFEKIAHMSVV